MNALFTRRLLVQFATSLIGTCAPSIAFAQNLSITRWSVVTGIVEKVSGDLIFVTTGMQLIALSVDDHTQLWKGNALQDVSTVEIGDDLAARYRTDASGKHVATFIRIDGVNFSAVISNVTSSGFEVFTNSGADPKSGYPKGNKTVFVDADTKFEASAREDLKVGRGVDVMGLPLRDGTVRAARVTVFEGNRPVRMGNARIILPNGQIR